ncbi:MAG: hypothetical protein GY789_01125, partial [Hyphomicrobiales bacterium]|nr:hypothetical protein [Hyphomicrobiales bacterium]
MTDEGGTTGGDAIVGMVGLGSIGGPMAASLVRAGVPTIVNDLDTAAVDRLVDAGAERA